MNYRQLGNTGIDVSEIGFGCWGIGGDAYGPALSMESKRALMEAAANGVNFFDTSNVYGNGRSEELLGDVFSHQRDIVVIATKGGCLPHTKPPMPQDFTPGALQRALDGSLRRLQMDYIDLYQLHSPENVGSIQIYEALRTLEMAKSDGKIRAIGVSLSSPNDPMWWEWEEMIDVFQVNLSLIDQRVLHDGGLDALSHAGKGVIARTPFCFGFLTGAYPLGVKFDPPDHRAYWPQKQIDLWNSSPEKFRHLTGDNRTLTDLALQFCLTQPGVSTVIPGMMKPEQVRENLHVLEAAPLTEDEIAEIHRIYRDNQFFVGRSA